MNRNPYAPYILASLTLQLFTTLAFASAMLGLRSKLRHAPLRHASGAWLALAVLLSCWLLAMVLRAQNDVAGFVLASSMVAAAFVYGHQAIATAHGLQGAVDAEQDEHDAVDPRSMAHWRISLVCGFAIGFAGHYWTYFIADQTSIWRNLWLRAIIVLVLLVSLIAMWRMSRSAGVQSRRPTVLMLGTALALPFTVLDGAIRIALAESAPYTWLPPLAVFSSFFGPFVLGVAYLVSALELERSHTRRSISRIERSLAGALERERLASLGRLAGTLAHEIHHRFSAIDQSLRRATMAISSESSALINDLGEAQEAVRRGVRLTNQLQTLAHQTPVRMEAFDVALLTRQVLRGIQATLPPTIRLESSANSISRVSGEAGRFDQLLTNLVVNGRDAMPHGGLLRVDVEDRLVEQRSPAFRGHLEPGPYVAINVIDEGVGIAPELVECVFEPFVSSKGERGTGLGLATVVAVVHEFRGALSLATTTGGTRFTIWLPAVQHPVLRKPAA